MSYLKGTPARMALPEMEKEYHHRTLWMRTWSGFCQQLVNSFGVVDETSEAVTRIRSLTQSNMPTAKYWVEFKAWAPFTGWDNIALRDEFKRGLSPAVKDRLVNYVNYDLPTSLEGLKDLAINIDNRLAEREKERKSGRKPVSHKPHHAMRFIQALMDPPQFSWSLALPLLSTAKPRVLCSKRDSTAVKTVFATTVAKTVTSP